MSMRVLVLKHHEEDSAGFVGDAFEGAGADLTTHLFPGDGPLPPVEGFDAVVVLGAKWSVYDVESIGSWIGMELDWLRSADEAGVPVLGICFGAQALTAAHGGRVELAPAWEIGWRTIEPVGDPVIDPGPWMQFHSDRCVLPDHAVLLAENEIGPQAFSLGPHLGVQFHPEVDGAQLSGWLNFGEREVALAQGVDPDALLEETIAQEQDAKKRAEGVVRVFLERSGALR